MRLVFAIAVAACLGWLAWCVARADAAIGPPFGPDRLVADMDQAALPPDAADRARRALRDRPIDGRAYRVLAQVAEREGNQAQAAALYAIAAERWPRERLAQAKLAEHAFANGDPAAGLQHLDALMRVAPATQGPVLAALMPAMAEAPFRAAMVEALRRDPPWRHALPAALRAEGTPADAAQALLVDLMDAGTLRPAEMAVRVDLLDRSGRHAPARAEWLAAVGSGPPATGLVYDGGFEHPLFAGSGYGWRWHEPAGVAMGMDPVEPFEGERAMAIRFQGRAVRFANLAQFLVLEPGDYRLEASASNGVDGERPFAWDIRCTTDGRSLLDLPLMMEDGWQTVRGSFTVPAGCLRQELRLRHTGRSLAERQIRGVLRLDGIGITQIP